MLVYYELQKIFVKRSNHIVLGLLIILMVYTCWSSFIQVEWIDDHGNSVTGHNAAVLLQSESQEWSGPMNQEMLEKVLSSLKEIYRSTKIDNQSGESNWILRHQFQGFQDVVDIIGWCYTKDDVQFEELVENLTKDDLSKLYSMRTNERKTWLYEDNTSWGYYNYSPAEKEYILNKFASFQTPLEFTYHEGWVQAIENLPNLLKYGIILLSFILAGIFSDEFTLKTDAVYYNSYYGRTKATAIKVGLGFLIITVAYWLCICIYSLVVLGGLGMDGYDCCIQTHANYWKIRNQISFLQFYLLAIGAGYLGYLFIGYLVLWISAKTKSPVLAVLIPSLLLLLPGFLWNFYSPTMRRIIGILPDKLLDISTAIQYLYLYSIGNRVMTAVPIVLTVYPCATAVLFLLCYYEYRHKQIS